MTERDPLLAPRGRRRRRLHPLWGVAALIAGLAGIAALWVWVFSPIFVTPQEFHGRQRRFDRVIREVLHARGESVSKLPPWPGPLSVERLELMACVEGQVVRGVRYASGKQSIDYPWGDLPPHIGTSPDLVIRCMRELDLDLQQMVHLDRTKNPKRYPMQLVAQRQPDKSLDHRRVAFLFTFAKAFWPDAPLEHDTPEAAALWLPGDIVFWKEGGREGFPGLIGVVLDRRDPTGMPLVATLHPDEGRATSHHRLDEWPVLGHFKPDIDVIFERFLEAYPGTAQEPRPAVQP
jgi:hypothetical protein